MARDLYSPEISLQVISVSRRIYDRLRRPQSGSVVAGFPRSCYVDLGGQIVAFVAGDLGNGPLNVVVAVPAAFAFDRIQRGTPVTSTGESIHVGSDLALTLDHAAVWQAALAPWQGTDEYLLRTGLAIVKGIITGEAPAESFARLLGTLNRRSEAQVPLVARAREGMVLLQAGVERNSPEIVAEAARTLGGLGPGLTPSGDDVLAGALIALAVLPRKGGDALREAIANTVVPRTTGISAAYLQAAARGEASEAWHALLDAIPRGDPMETPAATRRVMAFGETSGADTLAGFLLATDAILRTFLKEFRFR